MASKSYDNLLLDLNPFSKGTPRATVLFAALLAVSIIMGIAAVALMNYSSIHGNLSYILVKGTITGMLVIMVPALLTLVVIKVFKRYVVARYLLFILMVSTISYSIFILLGSIVYVVSGDYTLASAIILVGDASIFGWWFFVNKVLLGQRKRAVFLAVVQPTLNILLYIPYSSSILSFQTPFQTLLIKLYAGIFVFLLISYTILYVLDRPVRKSFGLQGVDALSQMLQNWLFDINTATPFGGKFGTPMDIATDTMVARNMKGEMKAVFFAPDIHYGPSGTLAGSDFPHMLERHVNTKYRVPGFIMHTCVNIDHNPVSVTQFNILRDTLDRGVVECGSKKPSGAGAFYRTKFKESNVIALGLGPLAITTLTRAPRVTEDVSPETAMLFKGLLEDKFGHVLLIDAHNSRYETAPKDELDGVKPNSRFMNEYIAAIKRIKAPLHKSASVRLGAANADIFYDLRGPIDLARGNLNVAVFGFNGFKYAIVQFNCNNMLPSIRNEIVVHMRR
ncbi:MAG: DUF2070 family protein, partial [Candidatus Micrarchaeota archaeon]|nr:DUF2070 family protein [Candidatus Micrarchaeota archaeon]